MNEDPRNHKGESHEGSDGQHLSDVQDHLRPDSYSGPRACMVLSDKDPGNCGSDSTHAAYVKIGTFERVVNAFIALLVVVAIIASVCIVPFALASYFIYIGLKKMMNLLFRNRNAGRFVILGIHGSYMIKDLEKREFVAKHIPNMRAAKKILRIFTSNTVQTRNK